MNRRLVTLAAASLLLCMATVALWVRSYYVRDPCPSALAGSGRQIVSTRGRIVVVRATLIHNGSPGTEERMLADDSLGAALIARGFYANARCADQILEPSSLTNAYGFGSASTAGSESINGKIINGYRFDVFAVPYWAGAVPLALAATVAVTRILCIRWAGIGHCRNCGYDLRATPQRCPECGALPGAFQKRVPSGPREERAVNLRACGG